MNCNKYIKLINMHVDNCITDSDYKALMHHINECQECNNYYNVVTQMVEDLQNVEEAQLPKGYENKLHFALERSKDTKSASLLPRRKKVLVAAMSAVCALILVVSSASIIGDGVMMNSVDQAAEEMPMAEAVYEDVKAEEAEEEIAEESLAYAKDEAASEPKGRDVDDESDGVNLESETDTETTSNTSGAEAGCGCSNYIHGDSIVIHLDVEDIQKVYDELNARLAPFDPKPDWVLYTEEPEEYLSFRCLDDFATIDNWANEIISDYTGNVEMYYSARVEYEDIDTELVGLQNHGYLFVVIK